MTDLPTDHDSDDPLGQLNAIEVVYMAVRLPPCPHCTVTKVMLPMTGTAWGIDVAHQPGCPDHEDSQPAVEYDFNDLPGSG